MAVGFLLIPCGLLLGSFYFPREQETSPTGQRPYNFAQDILPILKSNCIPCHFPGGKVYDEYPFDDQKTVATLEKKLFTRIKDEKQQAAITLWLNTVSSKPDSSAPRLGKKH